LSSRPACAQSYSVSLQADADQNQTNYTNLLLTTISGNQSATTSSIGPPSGAGSATSGGTAAIGSLSGAAGATGTGGGGGDAIIETQFTDTVTMSAGLYRLLYVPGGAVSASGGINTSAVAFTQATFTASALSGLGMTESFSQNVCAKEISGAAVSCGGGWQAAPTTMSATLDVTKSGSFAIRGSFVGEALADGGDLGYVCGSDYCYTPFNASATAGGGDPNFYIERESAGETISSASGASYAPPSVAAPEFGVASASGALTFLFGAILVMCGRPPRA
jgi:hypothetical protein